METSRNYNIDKGKGNGVEHIKKKFFFIKSKNFNNIPLHFVMVAIIDFHFVVVKIVFFL